MRRLLFGIIVWALAVPLWSQKIETALPSRDRVVPVHTALDHLTVIEVGEPVVTVAAGSPVFKIEWRDNRVFIEPTEAGVATNLFIWTSTGRLNYELKSGPVGEMDDAIDYPKLTAAPVKSALPSTSHGTHEYALAPSDFIAPMLGGQPVRSEFLKPSAHGVDIFLKDLFEQKGTLYIRFEIRNNSASAYTPGQPRVATLEGIRSAASLTGRDDWQLSDSEVHKLKASGQLPLTIVDGRLRASTLAPGESTVGVVGVKLQPSSQKARVLRIDFASDGHSPVTASLVL